jgi:hypothetical protein
MTGERRYTRIPPESTGDRLYMVHTAEIEFENKGNYDATVGYEWQIGKMYNIAGFGGNGMVHVHGVFDKGDGTGILAVHYNKSARFENLEPTVGAKIQYDIDNDDVLEDIADVLSFYDVYIPTQNIMGFDNPEYGLDIDQFGAANIRFFEGQPQLDAWGKLRVSQSTMMGNYVFGGQSKVDDNFSPVEIDGGAITYDLNRKSVKVGYDSASVTAATFAGNTSNTYHPYVPGSSHLWQGTFLLNSPASGDGINGATRRWGLFDAENGFFFQVGKDGYNKASAPSTTSEGLCVVIRSKTSGSVVNTIIPQDDWNGDKVDGRGKTQELFDLEKNNQYWIDIQWHGAGRVRFGTYLNGTRIILHTYYAGNIENVAMTQTASLPSCTSVKTAGTPLTELYIESWAQSVWTEQTLDLNEFGKPESYASLHRPVTANVDEDWNYLFSLSPKEVLPDGVVDHALFMPTSITAYAVDFGASPGGAPANGVDAVIDLKAEVNSILNHGNWTDIPRTNIQVSYPGAGDEAYEAGKVQLYEMFRGRYQTELTDTFNNFQYGSIKNFSEDGGTVENTITNVSSTNPAVITTGERLECRLPHTVTFPLNTNRYQGKYEINGLDNATGLNGNKYYVKPTSATSAELYTDEDLLVPVDGAVLTGTGAQATGTIKGFAGSRVTWNFYAKTRTALHADVKIMVTVNWKEIIQ